MGSKPLVDLPNGKIPVWLDCDPGHDDVFALLLISHHPHLHALGVSTTFGNASLKHTTTNALSILTAFRSSHIPVHPGAASPLCRSSICASKIHGITGIDGTSLLPEPICDASTTSAVPAMARTILATPRGSMWIICTGSLTNIAQLLHAYPEVATWVAGVSIMGGAIGDRFSTAPPIYLNGVAQVGNVSSWAEFNILADPEAAKEVLDWPTLQGKLTLIPLDITHLVIATEDVRESLLWGKQNFKEEYENDADIVAKKPNKLRRMMVELLNYFAHTYSDVFNQVSGPPLHDPVAVAVILKDEIPFFYNNCGDSTESIKEQFKVTVVTEGSFADAKAGAQTGRTLIELLPPGRKGVKIPRGIDVKSFWRTVENCLLNAQEQQNSSDFKADIKWSL